MIKLKIYGPPGTGKTTALVRDWIKPFLHDKHKIAVVSLTNATKKAFFESCTKQNIEFKDKNCRTMHSWTFQSLLAQVKIKKKNIQILETNAELMKKCMSEVFNIDLKEEEIEDMRNFLEVFEYSKNPAIAVWQACSKVRTSWSLDIPFQKHMEIFVKRDGHNFNVYNFEYFKKLFDRYTEWKNDNQTYDFTDLLMLAAQRKIDPFGILNEKLILIIDEIQDLYPLAFRIFQIYESNFDTIILAGDDDQAIYSFTGATPEMFLNYKAHEHILSQSYRLPQAVYEYALKIIAQNKIRKPKAFFPTNRQGKVENIFYENVFEILTENIDTLLLVRTNFLLQEYIKILEDLHIPYRTILKLNISEKIPRFLQIHETIRQGDYLTNDMKKYLDNFLEEVIYRYVRLRLDLKQLRKDAKEKIEQALLNKDPSIAQKYAQPVREVLSKELEEISTLNKELIQKWRYRLKNLNAWLNPSLRLATIHSAKGLEADRVIIDPRITQRIFKEMMTEQGLESERRVWYVAVTRSKNELFIVQPQLRSFYKTLTFPLPEI